MKKILAASLLCSAVAFPSVASADFIGASANVGHWVTDYSGNYNLAGSSADLEEDMGLESGGNTVASIHVEHPVPLIPNGRLAYVGINEEGTGNLASGFDGVSAGSVTSNLKVEQVDATAYYEILDNWVSVDLGLTLRKIDVKVDIQGGSNSSTNELSAIVPMVYGAASGALPFSGVSAGVEVNGVGFAGDSFMDATGYVQYDISIVELRGGYRQMAIDFEDGDSKIDVDMSGPFFSLGVDF